MFTPRHVEEPRLDVMHALIAANPFGALVRVGPNGMDADHLPFDIVPPSDAAPRGTLRAHVARANPVWREAGAEVLVVFASPSWNYAVVHAHGRLRVIDDPAWLRALVRRLTDRHETARPHPWKVAGPPDDYVETMLKAIIGIEIPIGRMQEWSSRK